MSERRTRIHALVDVLRVIEAENGRAKPTHILYKANLSYKILKDYLNSLLQKGFIEVVLDKNRTYYRLTEKGQQYLNEYRKLEKLSKVFGMPI